MPGIIAILLFFTFALCGPIGLAEESPASKIVHSAPYPLDACVVCNEPLGSKGEPIVIHVKGQEIYLCSKPCEKATHWRTRKYLRERDRRIVAEQSEFYPLKVCPLMPEWKLNADRAWRDVIYQRRMVRLCCLVCENKFEKNPLPVLAQLADAQVRQQKANYPISECVVDGVALGSRGPIIEYLRRGRLIRLCHEDCIQPLEKDAEKYLKRLDRETGKSAAGLPSK